MPDKGEVVNTVKEVDDQKEPTNMKQENSTVEKEKSDGKTNENEASPAKSEAMALLAQGKRHLFVKDYPSAVAALGDACAKLSDIYGELGDECGEAYFSYGRALLELSREESNVLVENEEEEGSEEDEKGDNEEETNEENGEEENEEDIPIEEEKPNEEDKTNEDKGDNTDEKTPDDNEEEKEEDVNNIQLAWEIFELAKVIFHRQNNESKLAETYLYLGEVSLESENYSSAIDDMKKCLDIQKKILAEDNRDIAETLFQLGVACSYEHMFEESKAYYKSASDLLQTRIKNLQSGCQPEDATTKNPFYTVDKEIEEIKSILPEIKDKIDDVEDLKRETLKSMMELAMKGSSLADGAGTSSMQNGTVEKPNATNISHLIKKKRKPEDEITPEQVKKSCTEKKPESS